MCEKRLRQEVILSFELGSVFKVDPGYHPGKADIAIPEIGIIVEFDGASWHEGKEDSDRGKTAALQELGWTVIRVRQDPLVRIADEDVVVPPEPLNMKQCADAVFRKICEITGLVDARVDSYLERSDLAGIQEADDYLTSIQHARPRQIP